MKQLDQPSISHLIFIPVLPPFQPLVRAIYMYFNQQVIIIERKHTLQQAKCILTFRGIYNDQKDSYYVFLLALHSH